MELAALAAELKKGPPAPVWLVHGDELFMIEEAVKLIVTAAVGRMDDPMLVTRVDLAEGKRGARDVLAACRSIGLFTSKVAVIVRAAEVLEKKADDREEIAKYIEKPAPGATLVLKASEKLDGRTALLKRLQKHAKVLTYPLLRPWEAEKWVQGRAREMGHRIDPDAAKLLVDLIGASMLALEQTLTQLSLYVGPQKPMGRADVEGALAATRAHTVFELTDAIAEKKAAQAIRHIDAMLEQREYPPVILGHLVRNMRQLVEVKALVDRGAGPDQIKDKMKIHEFVAKKLYAQAQLFDHTTLRAIFEELFRTELELKSTRLDPALRLEALALRLCASKAPVRARAPARAPR